MTGRLAILAPLKQWGGIERKMLILCREFVARGNDVEFILTRGGQVPYPDEFPAEVRIVDLQSRHKLDAIPRLVRHLRNSRPDALLTAKDHAAKVAVIARRLSGVDARVVVKVTNTLSETLRRKGKRRMARWLYPRADGIIAVSRGVKEDMISHFGMDPERIRVIYNPTVTPDMAERAIQPSGHPWLDTDNTPVVMAAGRLTPQKDFTTLLRAFALLRKERPCRLVILGEGPERPALEALSLELGIDADFLLAGYQGDPLPWMGRAAVFALSSRYEGLGNVLVEAMAVGTTVVSTDCPSGSAEILEDGRYGALVNVGDYQALAHAVAGALDRPMPREQLEQGAQRFRSDLISEQYLAMLGLEGSNCARAD